MSNPNDSASLVDVAIEAQGQGRRAKACQLLRLAAKGHSRAGEIHLRLGRILAARGRHQEALEALREAANHSADTPEVDQAVGASLLALGKHVEARDASNRARQQRPDFVSAHLDAGRASEALEDLNEAIACYRAATRYAPEDAETYRLLVSVHRRKGDYEAAAEALVDGTPAVHGGLSSFRSELSELLNDTGSAQWIINRLQQALDAGSRAPDEAIDDRQTWAELLAEAGRRDLAFENYLAAVRRAPRAEPVVRTALSLLILSLAGFVVADDKREDRAREVEAALLEYDADPVVWSHWWWRLLHSDTLLSPLRERAVERSLQLLKDNPEQAYLWWMLGGTFAADEDLLGRVEAIVEGSGSSEARFGWAAALLGSGRPKAAAKVFERIDVLLDTGKRMLWVRALFESERPDAALVQLRLCLESGNMDLLGVSSSWLRSALRSARDLGEHLTAIRGVVERSKDPDAMVLFAELLVSIGREPAAEGLARAALEHNPNTLRAYRVIDTCWRQQRPSAAKRRSFIHLVEDRAASTGTLESGKLLRRLGDDTGERLLRRAAEGYETEAGTIKSTADMGVAEKLLKASEAWLELNQLERAFDAFERATEAEPDRNDLYPAWAEAFGRYDEEMGVIGTLRRELDSARLSQEATAVWQGLRPVEHSQTERVNRLVERIVRNCDDLNTISSAVGHFITQGRAKAALDVYRHANALFCSDASVALGVAGALLRCGCFAEAAAQAEIAQVLAASPGNIADDLTRLQGFRIQAQSVDELGRTEAACSILEEALAKLPPGSNSYMEDEIVEVHLDWAGYLTARQRYDEAQDEIDAVLRHRAKYSRALFQSAFTAAEAQDLATATELYEKLSETDPDGTSGDRGTWATYAAHNLTGLFDEEGRYGAAKRQSQEACRRYRQRISQKLREREPSEYLYFAWMSERAGYEPAATEKLSRAATLLAPNWVEAHGYLVRFYADRRKDESSPEKSSWLLWRLREHYRAALKLFEDRLRQARTGVMLLRRGQLHLLVGEMELAKKDLLEARELGEDFGRAGGGAW